MNETAFPSVREVRNLYLLVLLELEVDVQLFIEEPVSFQVVGLFCKFIEERVDVERVAVLHIGRLVLRLVLMEFLEARRGLSVWNAAPTPEVTQLRQQLWSTLTTTLILILCIVRTDGTNRFLRRFQWSELAMRSESRKEWSNC